jgi:CubicO group peptidase (beta-lactamase class C family)
MRMTGWSMSKSVTSLLMGICLDRGLVASLDDVAEKYVEALKGTLHGGTSLRNLMNMASGAAISHEQDNQTVYPAALTGRDANVLRTIQQWNRRQEAQGTRFNYNELCPLTVGLVIRSATNTPLSDFAQQQLWQPIGAEANATWLMDKYGVEFNCIGFAARLRDWIRLGGLVASQGEVGGRQVVSRAWMQGYSRWDRDEQFVSPAQLSGTIRRPLVGYNRLMWHAKADGSRLVFNGAEAQRVLIDIPSQTVLAQTGVGDEGDWQPELFELFQAAVELS